MLSVHTHQKRSSSVAKIDKMLFSINALLLFFFFFSKALRGSGLLRRRPRFWCHLGNSAPVHHSTCPCQALRPFPRWAWGCLNRTMLNRMRLFISPHPLPLCLCHSVCLSAPHPHPHPIPTHLPFKNWTHFFHASVCQPKSTVARWRCECTQFKSNKHKLCTKYNYHKRQWHITPISRNWLYSEVACGAK